MAEHWINSENLTPDEKVEYFQRELQLAKEEGELKARKLIFSRLFEAGVGHYRGNGLFVVDLDGSMKGRSVRIDDGLGD